MFCHVCALHNIYIKSVQLAKCTAQFARHRIRLGLQLGLGLGSGLYLWLALGLGLWSRLGQTFAIVGACFLKSCSAHFANCAG